MTSKAVQIVVYATKAAVPADLKAVGLVQSADADTPPNVRRATVTTRANRAACKADAVVLGAVQYATVDLVPAGIDGIVDGG